MVVAQIYLNFIANVIEKVKSLTNAWKCMFNWRRINNKLGYFKHSSYIFVQHNDPAFQTSIWRQDVSTVR